MRLVIIRHGDPDYERDSLTEKGWREAACLAERMKKMKVDEYYVSPLGRAKDTASLTLKAVNREAEELEWLQEFTPQIDRPDADGPEIVWNWLPEDWTVEPVYYDMNKWGSTPIMRDGKVKEEYDRVIKEFDAFLAAHGYERDGGYYKAVRPNRDTIVFFCHFGLQCVLLSHLLSIPPMLLWHGTCAAPTSVTSIVTEERRDGKAIFRMGTFGDVSHLYAKGEEPAFAARFCETYDSHWERHD